MATESNDGSVFRAPSHTCCRWQARAGGAPLVGVDVAVVEDVDAVLVHEGLQHHAHLLVLLEGGVGGVQGVVVAGNHPAQPGRTASSKGCVIDCPTS